MNRDKVRWNPFPHFVSCGLLLLMIMAGTQVHAADRHAGYYYPEPGSLEEYVSKTVKLKDVDRNARISFVTDFTSSMLKRGYAPNYVMFVKGAHAEKVIITALVDDRLDTLYRMRGLLAMLTSQARETELFTALDVVDVFNFLDLLKFFGFEQLTVTDGDQLAHQITIK